MSAPSSTPTPVATTSAATTSAADTSGPMTGAELLWLEGLTALQRKMVRNIEDIPDDLTDSDLRAQAKRFASCRSDLDRLGPTTVRLQPVEALARKGCAEYAKTEKCFAAAKLCGFDSLTTAATYFGEAELRGLRIKETASGG